MLYISKIFNFFSWKTITNSFQKRFSKSLSLYLLKLLNLLKTFMKNVAPIYLWGIEGKLNKILITCQIRIFANAQKAKSKHYIQIRRYSIFIFCFNNVSKIDMKTVHFSNQTRMCNIVLVTSRVVSIGLMVVLAYKTTMRQELFKH